MRSHALSSRPRGPAFLLGALFLWLAGTFSAGAQTLTTPLWQDDFVNAYGWSTGEPVNFPVFAGNAAMKIGLGVGSGFSLDTYVFARTARINTVPYQSLEFYIHGGSEGGQSYRLVGLKTTAAVDAISGVAPLSPYLFDLNDQPLAAVPAGAWAKVKVPLSVLGFGSRETFLGVLLVGGASSNVQEIVAQPEAFIDEVRLTGPAPSGSAAVLIDLTKVQPAPFHATLPGVNLPSWAQPADLADLAGANNSMIDAGLKSFRAHLSNAAGNYDVGAWDFTADDNLGNAIAGFGKIIAGVPGARAFISYNQWLGSSQQAAALLAYCNLDPTDPAYLDDVAIGSATEWYLVNPSIGGTSTPNFATRVRDWKTVRFWVDLRRAQPLETDDGFNHLRIGQDAPWRFAYWELGNEPAGQTSNVAGEFVPDQHDAEKVALRFVADWNLLKSIDPSIKLGICAVPDNVHGGTPRVAVDNPNTPEVETYTGWMPVLLRTLRDQGVLPDWLSDHVYFFNTSDAETLTASLMNGDLNIGTRAATYRGMIDDYFAGWSASARSGVELHATEINNPTDDYRFTTSLSAGLLLADTLGHLMQTEYRSQLWFTWKSGIAHVGEAGDPFAGAAGWRDYGDWGMVGSDSALERSAYFNGVKFPTFFAQQLIQRFVQEGDQVVRTDGLAGNNIYLATYAVKKASGNVSLLVINKSLSTPIQAAFAFTGFVPGATATLFHYGHAQDDAQQNDTAITGTTVALDQSSASRIAGQWSLLFPPFSMTVVQLHLDQFERWRQGQFTLAELAAPAISGAVADPDGDGLANLLEFGAGLDPHLGNAVAPPVTTRVTVNDQEYLAITFTRRIDATDVVCEAQFASDVTFWSSGGILVGVPVDQLDGFETVTFRDTVSIDSVQARYVRLRVREL